MSESDPRPHPGPPMNIRFQRAILRSLSATALVLCASSCESIDKATAAMDNTLNRIQTTTDKVNNTVNETQNRIDRTEASIEEASQSIEEVVEVKDRVRFR